MGHTAPWNLDVTAGSGGRESLGRLVIFLSKCCTLHFYCGDFLSPFTELFVKSLQLFQEFFLLFGIFHLTKFILRFFLFLGTYLQGIPFALKSGIHSQGVSLRNLE